MFLYSATLLVGTIIFRLLLQPSNAFSPKFVVLVILRFTVTEESDEQFLNASSSIYWTLLGIVILSKLPHPLNAELPIAIKLVDNVTDCKFEHPSKALESICVTLLGIIIFSKFVQFLNE